MNIITGNALLEQAQNAVNGIAPQSPAVLERSPHVESRMATTSPICPRNETNPTTTVAKLSSSSANSLVETTSVEPKSPAEDGSHRAEGSTQEAAPSKLHNSNSSGKRKRAEIDENDPRFWELSASERSKILRARRNREAAHRSRTKNKARQELLEEETQKQIQLNSELCSLLSFLLNELNSASSSTQASNKRRKTSWALLSRHHKLLSRSTKLDCRTTFSLSI